MISNIDNKANGRWTCGKQSDKMKQLKLLQTQIVANLKLSQENILEYLQALRKIVAIKRNTIHFWHTPDSVKELEPLIQESGLQPMGSDTVKNSYI